MACLNAWATIFFSIWNPKADICGNFEFSQLSRDRKIIKPEHKQHETASFEQEWLTETCKHLFFCRKFNTEKNNTYISKLKWAVFDNIQIMSTLTEKRKAIFFHWISQCSIWFERLDLKKGIPTLDLIWG